MVQICSVISSAHQVRSENLFANLQKIFSSLGSGKSSALTPHMDALAFTLAQMDNSQEYIQYPNKDNGLPFEQPFIISNVCIR